MKVHSSLQALLHQAHVVALGGAFLTAVAVLGACASGDVAGESASESEVSSAKRLPNQTAWAEGTHWSHESKFMGLPHAWVYRPTGFSKAVANKRGVVFHLPGCGEEPFQVAMASGWADAAEEHGLVIVVPEVLDPAHPNKVSPNVACYRFGSTFSAPTRYSEDHAAIIAAGQKIVKDADLAIDPNQVYLAGLSAGATVAMEVGCMAPEIFAGVVSVAGTAMGTNQDAAVLPPTLVPSQVRFFCTGYAALSPASNATEMLKKQSYVIVSDNNGLPAGVPYFDASTWTWTASKFSNLDYWDGDKYVPYAHHDLIASAMAPVFGAEEAGKNLDLGLTGKERGCPGGEKSHDDTADVKCKFIDGVERNWRALADVWKDEAGLERIVHVKQDTLQHRWPSGPIGPNDRAVSPSVKDLQAAGFIDQNWNYVTEKVNAAPNGQLAFAFFANSSFSLPKYLGEHLAKNNPRLQ